MVAVLAEQPLLVSEPTIGVSAGIQRFRAAAA
jgi:hypothetical protein